MSIFHIVHLENVVLSYPDKISFRKTISAFEALIYYVHPTTGSLSGVWLEVKKVCL